MAATHEVDEVLDVLREEERSVSRQRTQLHGRLDFMHAGGYAHLDMAPDIAQLRELERELSARRRALHRQIDVARGERHRRRAHA